jgi:hypothetical protein
MPRSVAMLFFRRIPASASAFGRAPLEHGATHIRPVPLFESELCQTFLPSQRLAGEFTRIFPSHRSLNRFHNEARHRAVMSERLGAGMNGNAGRITDELVVRRLVNILE